MKSNLTVHHMVSPFFPLQKSFSTSTALKIHLISHTSDRDFRCPEPGCAFQTKYKSYLTLHGRKHNGKAHVCDFEGCGYTTLKMSLLQCHKRTHTNEKIFVCSECQVGRHAQSCSRKNCLRLRGFQQSLFVFDYRKGSSRNRN